jgi:hypothetical protein
VQLPAIDESVVVADFDTELVVLVPAERKAHLLEPMWALLFDSCRRGDELDDLVAELAGATHADGDATRTWVEHALAEFERLKITSS